MPARANDPFVSIAEDDDVFTTIVQELLAQGEARGLYSLGLEPVDLPLLYGAQHGLALRMERSLAQAAAEMRDGAIIDPEAIVRSWWKELGFDEQDLMRLTRVLDLNMERIAVWTKQGRGPRRKHRQYAVDDLREQLLIAGAGVMQPRDLAINRQGRINWRQFTRLAPLRGRLAGCGCLLGVASAAFAVLTVVLLLTGNDWQRWGIVAGVGALVTALVVLFSYVSFVAGSEIGLVAAEGQLDPVGPSAEYPGLWSVRLRGTERVVMVPAPFIPVLEADVWYRLYLLVPLPEHAHEGAVLSLEPVPPPVRGN